MSPADRLAEVEKELERMTDERNDLRYEVEALRHELLFNTDDSEPILEAIEDHRRGLLTIEELYERTVGR